MSANPLQFTGDVILGLYVVEDMTDEEARVYADLLSPEEARERLNDLLMSTEDDD